MITESQLDIAADALLLLLQEKAGEYTYEEITVKRWVLGDGGSSGNCDVCEDNEALGWIDMDAVFEGVDGDLDEPPAHPHCDCGVEYKDTRKRVYV